MAQGDFQKEEFDKDELAALGEAEQETAPDAETSEQEEQGPETQEADEKPAESETERKAEPSADQLAAAELMGLEIVTDEKSGKQYIVDEDGQRIPPKRFAEVYRKAKEGDRIQEKLDLFKKLGPEGYYRMYPAERPEPEERPQPQQPQQMDLGALPVVGGKYDGMTLREVYDVDPVFATALQNDFLWRQKEEVRKRQETQEQEKKSAKAEIEDFVKDISKTAYDKAPAALSKEESTYVIEVVDEVIKFISNTGRAKNMKDAFLIMNQEGLFSAVAQAAAKKAIQNLAKSKAPPSIDTGIGGNGRETGFEGMEKMTESQLAAKLDAMSDKEAMAFLKNAPKSLRAKHPSLPWG